MQKESISSLLSENEDKLREIFISHDASLWVSGPQGKWTAGQHVVHLVQSSQALLRVLKLPKFFIKWKFGTCNRPTRSFDEVKERYEQKLSAAGTVISPFSVNMPQITIGDKPFWLDKLSKLNANLNKVILGLSEKHLDGLVIPHPLMGKLTIREILMWNAHHLEHHTRILKQKYT